MNEVHGNNELIYDSIRLKGLHLPRSATHGYLRSLPIVRSSRRLLRVERKSTSQGFPLTSLSIIEVVKLSDWLFICPSCASS
ncbi:uncharacterized protein [Miscanthus floridulus]|uniref:uncharacterized protein isoform X3 n=1 Tax=Miscanthus floridulus TaxID=154761 RepID=UPI0034578B91